MISVISVNKTKYNFSTSNACFREILKAASSGLILWLKDNEIIVWSEEEKRI